MFCGASRKLIILSNLGSGDVGKGQSLPLNGVLDGRELSQTMWKFAECKKSEKKDKMHLGGMIGVRS